MKKILSGFTSIVNFCIKVFEKAESLFLIWMTLIFGALIMVDIILRAVGIQGIYWLEEFSRYMLVTTTFVGCSVAVKTKGHMLMDLIITKVKPLPRLIIECFTNTLCGAFMIYLSYYAYKWMSRLKVMKTSAASADGFHMYIIWIIVAISFVTMGIRYFYVIYKDIQAYKNEKTAGSDIAPATVEDEG